MHKPTDGVVTFPYGATTYPYSVSNPHAGVDYGANQGDNIYAPHPGTVNYVGNLGDCGLAVDIQGGKYKSRLCHNSQLLVSNGQQVNEGQVIAKAGATGKAIGVHSHWVLWDNGTRVDGSKYVSGTIGDMYNGQSAKFWHDQLAVRDKELENATRIANERQAFVLGTLKRLGELLNRPTTGDIPEADFYVDEAVKGWKFRQSIVDELQKKIKELQEKGNVTPEEIDKVIKEAQEALDEAKKLKE